MSKFKAQLLLASTEMEQDISSNSITCVNIAPNQLGKLKFQGNIGVNLSNYSYLA